MRKLMMKMSMSVDGFVASANGRLDWLFRSADDTSTAWVIGLCQSAGLHIMGSKSFHDMASYWPTSPLPIAKPMNEIPKAFFTLKGTAGFDPSGTTKAVESARQFDATSGIVPTEQSPAAASWAEARIFSGDLAENIKALKAEPGKPILAHGGAGFMRSLIETGLIDEYHLVTHPIVLGSGLPIFNGLRKELDLKLVDAKVFPGGIIAHTYHPA